LQAGLGTGAEDAEAQVYCLGGDGRALRFSWAIDGSAEISRHGRVEAGGRRVADCLGASARAFTRRGSVIIDHAAR